MERQLATSLLNTDVPTLSAEDREEAQWVDRARAGEQVAFTWLLSRYRERAVRLAAHVLRRQTEAEDVAQEAFIKAFRSISSYRNEGRFYTWLYHIVVRVCIDRQRTARWSREAPLEALPDLCAADADMRIQVAALLDRLSPTVRATLVLREIEGLEYQEIAQVLEIPVGTVRSRISSARSQFREMWAAVVKETSDV